MGRYLSGQTDNGDRIHKCIGQARDRVGGAGAGGHQHHAGLSSGPRVTLCRVHCAALLPDQNMTNLVLRKQGVINWQYSAPRIAENYLYTLVR